MTNSNLAQIINIACAEWADAVLVEDRFPSEEATRMLGEKWIARNAAIRAALAAERETAESRVNALESALMAIAEGTVETRYSRDDLERALYHIDGVRAFAYAVLRATTPEARDG